VLIHQHHHGIKSRKSTNIINIKLEKKRAQAAAKIKRSEMALLLENYGYLKPHKAT